MIYDRIKNDLKNSIRDESLPKEYIKVVVSEFDRIGKDLSDEICIKELTKLKKSAVVMNNTQEIEYLDNYLPQLMGEDEIETQICHYIDSGIDTFAGIMKAFNMQFKGKADNKLVSKLVLETLNKP